METINDRIEMLVNERFMGNKAAFAKTIGLQPTGLSNYLGNKRRSKPSVDMIAKIVLALNVDARWLITGESEHIKINNHIETNGDHSPASINGSISQDGNDDNMEVLRQNNKNLEALISEKDEQIKVLKDYIDFLKSTK